MQKSRMSTSKLNRKDLSQNMHAHNGAAASWVVENRLVDYPHAVSRMEELAAAIHSGDEPERVWLIEHPPLYTAGTSANDADLLNANLFPVHQTGRGGEYTLSWPWPAGGLCDAQSREPDAGCQAVCLHS